MKSLHCNVSFDNPFEIFLEIGNWVSLKVEIPYFLKSLEYIVLFLNFQNQYYIKVQNIQIFSSFSNLKIVNNFKEICLLKMTN